MLTISFEKYDNLDTEAELFEISDDYTFPKIQDFQSKLDEKMDYLIYWLLIITQLILHIDKICSSFCIGK